MSRQKIKRYRLIDGKNEFLWATDTKVLNVGSTKDASCCVWVAEDPAPSENASFVEVTFHVKRDGDTLPPKALYIGTVVEPQTGSIIYHVFIEGEGFNK